MCCCHFMLLVNNPLPRKKKAELSYSLEVVVPQFSDHYLGSQTMFALHLHCHSVPLELPRCVPSEVFCSCDVRFAPCYGLSGGALSSMKGCCCCCRSIMLM